MSLPYPSMTFVPLDVLTADEMNQLVANIESLADGSGLDAGAIETSAIANSAITSQKIDWTTLSFLGNLSFGETLTPFTDFNGEPLYRAIVDIGTLPNNAWTNVNVSSLNIKRCYRCVGAAWDPNQKQVIQLPYASTAITSSVAINYTNNNISIGTENDRQSYTSCYAELIYTKNS